MNTSIVLTPHFQSLIQGLIKKGRYHSVSEVIRAGLRLLEDEENLKNKIRQELKAGESSGLVNNFEPEKHLNQIKSKASVGKQKVFNKPEGHSGP